MSDNYKTDVFFNTISYYDYSNGYSTVPREINFLDKYQELCEKTNCSWLDDNGFI